MEMATTATSSRSATMARAFPLKYFVFAFAFTWLFWGLQLLAVRDVIPMLPGLTVIGTLGPLVAAVVITAQESGRAGLRALLSRIVRWRVAPIWYAVALLGPLVITLGAIALHVALGGQPPSLAALIGALPILLIYVLYMLIFVALGEEVGWRGYALPALQARYSALISSVILGVMWGLWHLPQFFNPATFYSNIPFVLWLAFIVPFAVLISWVFNSTGGSVLMAMFFHAVMNASTEVWKAIPQYSIRPASVAEAVAATVHINLMSAILLWVAAAAIVVIYGPLDLSRRPRQVVAHTEQRSSYGRAARSEGGRPT
jgi:membrane protease YdiL (CAAX protease family)